MTSFLVVFIYTALEIKSASAIKENPIKGISNFKIAITIVTPCPAFLHISISSVLIRAQRDGSRALSNTSIRDSLIAIDRSKNSVTCLDSVHRYF